VHRYEQRPHLIDHDRTHARSTKCALTGLAVPHELLGQRDDDTFGAAEVTEPILVLVLRHLANEFGSMLLQPANDVVDVVDGEHDATDAQRVRRCVCRLRVDSRWPMELHQLEPAVAVRGPHHCDVDSDAIEPDDAVHPASLDWHLALQLQTKFDEESDSSCDIVEDNAHVVHPLNRHSTSIAH
jgi:hypothetical protein